MRYILSYHEKEIEINTGSGLLADPLRRLVHFFQKYNFSFASHLQISMCNAHRTRCL